MKYIFLLAGLTLLLAISSCGKGDTGPEGPSGPQGPQGIQGAQGPQGIAGNANVMQYSYGVQNLSSISFAQLQLTTTRDTMDKSAWFVYLYYATLDRWYFVPGAGAAGTTQYRLSMGYSANKVNIYIDKSGPGESYAQAKVIRIYSTGQLAGGRYILPVDKQPYIDYTNYETVRSYYQLP